MDKLQRLLSRYGKAGGKEKAPERFGVLAALLGVPDGRVKYVHVAGTNGKGSVCGFIACALSAAGEKTGLFASPYVVDITERISVDGANIPKAELERLCAKAAAAAETAEKSGHTGFSQFEILAAAALVYFSEERVAYAVIETGIGGLMDCTNIITPEVGVITRVSLDHTDILGDSAEKIARHKTGIIKKNVPCVVSPSQSAGVMRVIEETAATRGAALIVPDLSALGVTESSVFGSGFVYKGRSFRVNMGGEHQIRNALTAIEALGVLDADAAGISNARLAARLQVLSENPLLISDGAHNPDGLRAARTTVEGLPGKKVVVAGMLSSKDYEGGLKELVAFADAIVLTDGFSPLAARRGELAAICRKYGAKEIYAVKDEKRAVLSARELAGSDGVVLVCGSFYLAGKILQQ
ncbi:MAG: bifunctional folylpolyglutamate synthase/dihydrofolate synthase [Oscillospiraceae bacterium]|jgi:dihydrofolate synthase/folylpolyglutamate synthase|nr:bifunctional folylpolyglutamate synthase/dihydrofolate synthase [Oscillospiraceae bacterium]